MELHTRIKKEGQEIYQNLNAQGIAFELTPGNKLRILTKTTPNQFEIIRLWKKQIIEALSPKTNDELADYKAEKLHEVLNRFIEKGITFDVSATDFQVIDPAQVLKTSDKEFLKLNSAAILCTLQQSLLMKHLFSHSPEQFEDFAFEIAEREAIMTNDANIPFAVHCEAVKDVSSNWFAELLNKRHTKTRLD